MVENNKANTALKTPFWQRGWKIYLTTCFVLFFVIPIFFHGVSFPSLMGDHVYYRVRIELEYKGQPFLLNTVVDCKVQKTRPLGGAAHIEFIT